LLPLLWIALSIGCLAIDYAVGPFIRVERAARELRQGARGVPNRLLSFAPFPTQLNTFVRPALVTAATPGCLMRRSAEIA
jgi:hypothetical protein